MNSVNGVSSITSLVIERAHYFETRIREGMRQNAAAAQNRLQEHQQPVAARSARPEAAAFRVDISQAALRKAYGSA